jgi:hypothetical protein
VLAKLEGKSPRDIVDLSPVDFKDRVETYKAEHLKNMELKGKALSGQMVLGNTITYVGVGEFNGSRSNATNSVVNTGGELVLT